MQELEKKLLDLDQVEKKVTKIFFGLLFVFLICMTALLMLFRYLGIKVQSLFTIVGIAYGLFAYPYLLFHQAKCPYCKGQYFQPFLMMRSEMKKILNSSPACIKCAKQAKIISRYLD